MENVKRINFVKIDNVDEKTLVAAKYLVEKNLVAISYGETNWIKFPFKVCEAGTKGSDYLLNNIMEFEISNNRSYGKQVPDGQFIDLTKKCKNAKCQFKCCPLMVAGYFRNLCDLNPKLEESIENITSIKSDKELNDYIESLIGINDTKQELKKMVKLYAKVRKTSDKFYNSNQFYNNYALIGNEGLQQEKIVGIIKSILVSNAIIEEKEYKEFYTLDLSFDNFTKKRKNLSDIEPAILEQLKESKLIYLSDFDKIISLKSDKEDFYYKLINTLKKIIIENNKKIFIISGTTQKLETIFNENGELSSLFGYKWNLSDLSNEELSDEIFKKIDETKINEDICKTDISNVVPMIARESNFKNLNFVEEFYQKILKNYFESDSEHIVKTMIPQVKTFVSIDEIMKEINQLIGMNKIKNELKNLSKFLQYNKQLENINGISKTLNLHMVFSGNAGTGKTTVARLLADILYNMGYIEERKITEITPKDLIGEYIGQTAPKARKTIENALGGILFIDEAYGLAANNGKNYGAEAIVELLKCMEDYQDKLVVIFAGYHDEMNDFINLNPGLKSRIRYYFDFEDYNEDELIDILNLKLNKLHLTIEDEALKTLKRTISYNMKATNFGNGRYVDNLINNLLIKHSLNISGQNDSNLLNITTKDVNDLSETNDLNINNIFADLDKLVGLSNVKEDLKQLVDYLQYNKKLEKINIYPKNLNLHMVFSGNAGTGKTTVARLLANIFYNLGYIPENRLTEITAKDLTGEYLGQTAPKVRRQIENALGGVLFIDEAYSLVQNYSNGNGYSGEAIAELMVSMEKYYDRLIIVFAGYEKEMKDFLNANPGLKSRIGKNFVFEDYSVDELVNILENFVHDNKLQITSGAIEKFKNLAEKSMKNKNFGNGRWVRNCFDNILLIHSTNTKDTDDEIKLITIDENDIDIEKINKFQKTTKGKLGFDIKKKDEKKDDNNIAVETYNKVEVFDFEEVDDLC